MYHRCSIVSSICIFFLCNRNHVTGFSPSSKTLIIPLKSSTLPKHKNNYSRNNRREQTCLASSSSEVSSPTIDNELDVDGNISSWNRLVRALPKVSVANKQEKEGGTHNKNFGLHIGDELDRTILGTAIPSMINLAVVPVVNAVDTFWVGQMGIALALAGQAAANQVFFTLYFLIAFLPTITAPLVAKAVGSNDLEAAQSRVCEALFLSNVLGGLGTLFLVGLPRNALRIVLANDAPALEYAIPYLRLRALSMVPSLFAATGFAAYRGMLNTVTPLKVSLLTNAVNLVMDPLLIFSGGLGAAGAALATAGSEILGGFIYLKLLLRRKLVRWSRLLRPPKMKNLLPLIQGGAAMLLRQATLNVAFLTAARRAQAMDPSGVAAAAYGITMQIYSVGVVVHLGIQSTAATLVPNALAQGSVASTRSVADRIFIWGTLIGFLLAASQLIALPYLVPFFTTLPEVQEAIKAPALISSFIHLVNGPVFAGEGTMLGLGKYKALATVTAMGVGVMVSGITSPLGKRLDGILLSLAAFNAFQAMGVVFYHLRVGPLRRKNLFRGIFTTEAQMEDEVSISETMDAAKDL